MAYTIIIQSLVDTIHYSAYSFDHDHWQLMEYLYTKSYSMLYRIPFDREIDNDI